MLQLLTKSAIGYNLSLAKTKAYMMS